MRKTASWALLGLVLAAAAAVACGAQDTADPELGGAGAAAPGAGNPSDPSQETGGAAGAASAGPSCTGEPVDMMDKGSTQLAALCGRGYGDPVSRAFCAAATPTITSVTDVL